MRGDRRDTSGAAGVTPVLPDRRHTAHVQRVLVKRDAGEMRDRRASAESERTDAEAGAEPVHGHGPPPAGASAPGRRNGSQ